jgi:hypothetical protein
MGYGQYNGRNPALILAEQWHGGQFTGLYALQCGALDADTLERSAREFRDCADKVVLDPAVGITNVERERDRLTVAAQWCDAQREVT